LEQSHLNNPSQDIYLRYQPIYYPIRYELYGGSNPISNPNKYVFASNNIQLRPAVRNGYRFGGWFDNTAFLGDPITVIDSRQEGITLHAKWEIEQYYLTFKGFNDETLESYSLNYNHVIADELIPIAPEIEGLVFLGWDNPVPDRMPSSDVLLQARYAINNFEILFIDQNDNPLYRTLYQFNDSLANLYQPEPPLIPGYSFIRWSEFIPSRMPAKNLTFKAIYTINNYFVTFNPNNGSNPTQINVIEGQTLNPISQPVLNGFEFDGWFTDPELTQPYNFATPVFSNFNLYAKWQQTMVGVAVIYYANGATSGTMETQFVTSGISFNLNSNLYQKIGHTFRGWSLSSVDPSNFDVLLIEYLDGESIIINNNQNLNLYAVWEVNNYTLTFTSSGSSVPSQTLPFGSNVIAPTNPTREGYIFSGWLPSIPTTMPAENITLNAQWNIKSFNIYFNSNYGAKSILEYYSASYDDNFLFLESATRTGYTFSGWSETELGVVPYTFPNKIPDLGSNGTTKTFYAIWTANIYTITFNAEGGTNLSETTKNVTFNGTYGTLPTVSRSGYTFSGWFNQQSGGTQVIDSTVFNNVNNLNLYARWAANSYTVTFDSNEGEAPTPSSINVTYGQQYGTLATVSRTNYNFIGWYTQAIAGELITASSLVTTYENHTLYARWTQVSTFTLTFDKNNVSATGSMTNRNLTLNEGIILDNIGFALTGHIFVGWALSPLGAVVYNNQANFTQTTSENITLYAIWNANEYTLTFNASGGTTPSFETKTVYYGDQYGALPTTSQTGYTFNGWFDASSGGAKIESTTTVSITSNQTLYAQWSANQYTVTLKPENGNSDIVVNNVIFNQAMPTAGLTVPLRTGYTFQGYYSQLGGLGLKYYNTDMTSARVYDIDSNSNLYAHWTGNSDVTYTVEIYHQNIQDDNYTLVSTSTETGTAGEEVTYSPSSYQGFDYTTSENVNELTATSTNYQSGLLFLSAFNNPRVRIRGDGTTILRIKYNRKLINVVFKDGDGNNLKSEQVRYGGSVVPPSPPTKPNKLFKQWNKAYSNITNLSGTYQIDPEFTDVYTVTYELDGGTQNPLNPETFVESNNRINLSAPTKTGYTFLGWFSNIELTNQVTFIQNQSDNLTLYARWQVITFTVEYVVGSNAALKTQDLNTNVDLIQTKNYGSSSLVTVVPNNGYKFIRWSDNVLTAARSDENITSDIYLVAEIQIITYTIVYDLNGGSLSGSNPATYRITSGDISLINPLKTGVSFEGWYVGSVESGIKVTKLNYDAFGSNESITLVAKFVTYPNSITYIDLFGVVNPNPAGFDQNTVTLIDPSTTRNGYTFGGWAIKNVSNEFEIISSVNSSTTSFSNNNIDVYARWTAISYNISYVLNGASTNTNPSTYTIESSISLANPGSNSDANLTFVGWFDADFGGNQVSVISSSIGNITLYARWQNTTNINLAFNINGGTGLPTTYTRTVFDEVTGDATITNNLAFTTFSLNSVSYPSIKEPSGTQLAIGGANSNTINNVTRNGYTFGGWFTSTNFIPQNRYIIDNPTFMVAYDTLLVARWNLINYTITYDLESLYGSTHTNPSTYNIESNITLSNPNSRSGYTFNGWYKIDGGSEVTVTTIQPNANDILSAITLYARWSINSYSLQFDGESYQNSFALNFNQQLNQVVTSWPSDQKASERFIGWTNNGSVYNGSEQMPANNLVLTPLFTDKVYLVDYRTYGGINSQFNRTSFNFTDLQLAVNSTFELYAPTRDGYLFEGWYTSQVGGIEYTEININNYDTYAIEDNNNPGLFTITLHARWSQQTYSITYNLDGGTPLAANPTTYNILTPTITFANLSKTGYTFDGWYSNSNLNPTSRVYTLPQGSTGNKIYYAKFVINFYQLSTYGIATAQVDDFKAGFDFHVMLNSDGRVFTWGRNTYGQLGNGSFEDSSFPSEITQNFTGLDNDEKIIDIQLGSYHALALTSNGKVFAWGYNAFGQIGDGTTANRNLPVNITSRIMLPTLHKVWKISAGFSNSWIITSKNVTYDNTTNSLTATLTTTPSSANDNNERTNIFGWGYNLFGQIGDNTKVNRLLPVNVSNHLYSTGVLYSGGSGSNAVPSSDAGGNIIKITGGDGYSGILTDKGRVMTWGRNDSSKKLLGDGSGRANLVPQYANRVNNSANYRVGFKDIFIGAETSYGIAVSSGALANENDVFVWGSNETGQYASGNLTNSNRPVNITSTLLSTNESIRLIDGKYYHTIVVVKNSNTAIGDKIYIFGKNNLGQIGNGTSSTSMVTTKFEITASADATIKLTLDSGEIVTGIAVSSGNSAVFTSAGKVYVWGDNTYGQLGIGTNGASTSSTKRIDLSSTEGGGFKIGYDIYTFAFGDDISGIAKPGNSGSWYTNPNLTDGLYNPVTMPANDLVLYHKPA
jgi:uncharacterized repeat protein (TIGR02543 family)